VRVSETLGDAAWFATPRILATYNKQKIRDIKWPLVESEIPLFMTTTVTFAPSKSREGKTRPQVLKRKKKVE
jgi:hypothetical protein